MELPDNEEVMNRSLSTESQYYSESLNKVEVLGSDIVTYKFDEEGLSDKLPDKSDLIALVVLKIY